MLSESIFRAQLVIHEQRELYDYWRDRAGERPMPARRDIDPRQIVSLLPSVSLVELGHGPANAWYRLAGTRLHDIYGFELTGKRVAEVAMPGRVDYWSDVYERIIGAEAPMHGAVRGPVEGRDHLLMFWLRLPLSDGAGVNRVLCYDTCVPAVGEFGESSPFVVPPIGGRASSQVRARARVKACA